MKKVLSVILAAALMCTVCIPAFAANTITHESDPQSGSTVVKVDTSNVPEDGMWTVTYPAEINVEWGAESTTIADYEITTHLAVGKNLKVDVTKADDKLTYESVALAYALDGETSVKVSEVATVKPAVTVKIAANDWNNAPIAAYEGNITFTAEVVDAA